MPRFSDFYAFGSGSVIGLLGGLIGLGGAEFRLPVLVGLFRYRLLMAIVINLSVSLVTVCASLIFRIGLQHSSDLFAHWSTTLNLLGGSVGGSYIGVQFATRVPERVLSWSVAGLLVFLSILLIGHDRILSEGSLVVTPVWRVALGLAAGVAIGAVCSLLGVAGGELIIPTLLLLFGLEIKEAGTVSLAISVPTILVGLARYRSRPVFAEVRAEHRLLVFMALGSILGAWIGSLFLRVAPGSALQVVLGIILLISAWKISVTRHQNAAATTDADTAKVLGKSG